MLPTYALGMESGVPGDRSSCRRGRRRGGEPYSAEEDAEAVEQAEASAAVLLLERRLTGCLGSAGEVAAAAADAVTALLLRERRLRDMWPRTLMYGSDFFLPNKFLI